MKWLSRGIVLERFVTLRKEVREFLIQRKYTLLDICQKWLLLVAYFSDILSQLNILNHSLQGPNIILVDVSRKMLAFKENLKLWKRKTECQKTASFPVLNQFLEVVEVVCLDDVQIVMKRYLTSLIKEFDLIISQMAKELKWACNTFAVDVDALPENCQSVTGFEEEFIDIQCDSSLKNIFATGKLG